MRKLKNLRLSTKIGAIISVMLLVIFSALIGTTAFSAGVSLQTAISDQLTQQSNVTGEQVQSVFNSAVSVAENMEDFLSYIYKQSQAINEAGAENNYTSEVYDLPVKAVPYTMEQFLLNTARSTVNTNRDITGVGTLFERNMFAANIPEYAFYVDEANSRGAVGPFEKYDSYSQESYYANAKTLQRISVTKPLEYNGHMMVSVSAPILYNDRFMGAIVVDINVSNFSRIKVDNSRYSSLYGLVLDEEFTIVYDSRSTDTVGKSLADMSGGDSVKFVQELAAAGEDFKTNFVRPDGSTITGFFAPIDVGGEQWWALTALDTTEMYRSVSNTVLFLMAISAVGLVLLVAVVILVLRRMLKPINGVVSAAERIAAGDFDVHLEAKSGDEIGKLTATFDQTARILREIVNDIAHVLNEVARQNLDVDTGAEYVGQLGQIQSAIRNIVANLSHVIGEISQSADQVSAGSEQVSAGAQALSQGATEQASSVEELAATINEISDQVQENAVGAEQARTYVEQVSKVVSSSNQQMEEMTQAMDDISASAGEIGKIIATIENIAFQTNILALNAAVEAARAGTAGKGFAVVADEVRNLATKSSEASKSTAALIDQALRAVDHGVGIAGETAASLHKVVEGTQTVIGQINQIATASQNQAGSISQVTEGMDQISSVVQTNSATAEESAAASEELSAQAQTLKDLVASFKLKSGGESQDREVFSPAFENTTSQEGPPSRSYSKY